MSGSRPFKDPGSGQYHYVDASRIRRPAVIQEVSSHPRTIVPTTQQSARSQPHNLAGTSPPVSQERYLSQSPVPYPPRVFESNGPTVQHQQRPTNVPSSSAWTARRDSGLSSQPPPLQSNQWMASTSANVSSAQLRSPQHSTVVPAPSSDSTDVANTQHAYSVGILQSGECQACFDGRQQRLIGSN
jgi:hypothetical protein